MSELLPYMKCFKPLNIWLSSSQKIAVPCGKCPACLNTKRSSLALKLRLEETHSKYCYFLTLTYDDDSLPLYKLEDSDVASDFLIPVPISDRIVSDFSPEDFDAPADSVLIKKSSSLYDSIASYNKQVTLYNESTFCKNRNYRCPYGNGTFALLYYRDIQLFFKRLRKYVKKNYDETLRYYIIGEYGTRSLRPHWHILLFFNSSVLAKDFEIVENLGTSERPSECPVFLRSLWKYGIIDSKRSDGKAFYYVSSYVAKPSDFPLVLDSLSPQKAYHSRYLGEVLEKEYIIKCLESKDFDRLRHSSVVGSDGTLSDYTIWRSYYSRFFPKYSGMSFQDIDTTFQVFESYERVSNFYGSFSINYLASCLFNDFRRGNLSPTTSYFRKVFDVQFALCLQSDTKVLSALCSALRASRNFLTYANTLGITPSAYFRIWKDWYKYVDLSTLNDHFRNCELDSEYARLYYNTMRFRPDGSSEPRDYTEDKDILYLGIRSSEYRKYHECIKHRDVVSLIQTQIGI